MNCPFCGGSLTPEDHAGIEIDRCTGCASLWFDRDELVAYLSSGKAGLRHDVAASTRLESDFLTCPRCVSATLYECLVSGVNARHCSGCGGVAIEADSVPGAARQGGYTAVDAASEAILWAPDIADAGGTIVDAVIDFASSILDLVP